MCSYKTFETSFFFKAGFPDSLAEATDVLFRAFVDAAAAPRLVSQSDTESVLQVNGVTLTLRLHLSPLDLRPFDAASCPEVAFGLSAQKQRALVAHRAAVVLRVSEGRAHPQVPLGDLAARALVAHLSPALVYCAQSNQIFTQDEFAARNLSQDAEGALAFSAPRVPEAATFAPRNTRLSRATFLLVENVCRSLLRGFTSRQASLRSTSR